MTQVYYLKAENSDLKKGVLMTALVKEIAEDVMGLPLKERAELAHRLIESLDDKQDEHAEIQWMKEIDKRSNDIHTGNVTCRLIEDVVADIRRKLKDARSQSSRC